MRQNVPEPCVPSTVVSKAFASNHEPALCSRCFELAAPAPPPSQGGATVGPGGRLLSRKHAALSSKAAPLSTARGKQAQLAVQCDQGTRLGQTAVAW